MKRFIAFLAVVALATFLSAQPAAAFPGERSEEHTSELQSQSNLVCRLLLEKKKKMMLSFIRFNLRDISLLSSISLTTFAQLALLTSIYTESYLHALTPRSPPPYDYFSNNYI